MNTFLALTSAQLKRAAAIKEKIAKLEHELVALLGKSGSTGNAAAAASAGRAKKKRKMSAAGRARIIAAQKARWAKIKAASKK